MVDCVGWARLVWPCILGSLTSEVECPGVSANKHWWTLRVEGGGGDPWDLANAPAQRLSNRQPRRQDGETARRAPIPHSQFRAKAEPEPATRGNPKSTSVINLVRFDALNYFAVRAPPYANANAKAKCRVLVAESNASAVNRLRIAVFHFSPIHH